MKLVKQIGHSLVVLLVLWLPFSAACVLAIPVATLSCMAGRTRYAKDILHATDLVLAALLGLGFKYTVSAWCAVRPERHFRLLRAFLNSLEEGHCEAAARNEGLLPPVAEVMPLA